MLTISLQVLCPELLHLSKQANAQNIDVRTWLVNTAITLNREKLKLNAKLSRTPNTRCNYGRKRKHVLLP